MAQQLLVLGWHNVHPTFGFPASPRRGERGLASQLRTLARCANVVDLGQALTALAAGRELPPRAVALTFDDGYRDNHDVVAPMLRATGLPATFFLVPEFLSGATDVWWERLGWAVARRSATTLSWEGTTYRLPDQGTARRVAAVLAERLKARTGVARAHAVEEVVERLRPVGPDPTRRLLMTWDQARSLVRQGFSVGSHTSRHDILSREPAGDQVEDLRSARALLQDRLQVEASLLAYPNGRDVDYDDTSLAAVQAAGHTHAVTTVDGVNGPEVPRYEVRRTVVFPERGVPDLLKALVHSGRAPRPGR